MLVPLHDRPRLLRIAAKPPIRYRVNVSADDGTACGDAWNSLHENGHTDGIQLHMGDYHTVGGYTHRTGIRFFYPGGIQVAKGQQIKAAKIRLQHFSLFWPNYNDLIRAEAADNAAVFATFEEIWSRPRGAASVLWNESITWDSLNYTPDIKALIQEVVNRPGWVKGNALVVYLDATASTGQPSGFSVESWNTTVDNERRPWLYIWL